jgi:hypothetical protein
MFFRPFFLSVLLAFAGFGLPMHAATLTYFAVLSGAAEAPPNPSPATGTATVIVDTAANTLRMLVSFSGLVAPSTAAHIHGPTAVADQGTAGVIITTPSLPDFPLGVTAGSYDMTFDTTAASTYNPQFLNSNGGTPESAGLALFAALAGGKAYFNLHSSAYPGGEIRGFLHPPAPIPLPASLPLLVGALALAGAIGARRRRH